MTDAACRTQYPQRTQYNDLRRYAVLCAQHDTKSNLFPRCSCEPAPASRISKPEVRTSIPGLRFCALGGPAALMGPPSPQEHGKTDQGAETKKAGRRSCFPAFFYSVVFELTCVRYSHHWGLLFSVSCCYNNPCVKRSRLCRHHEQLHTPLKKSALHS